MRKRTLRRLPPVTREYARLLNQLDSLARKFKNRLPELEHIEIDSRALANARNPEFFWYPEPKCPAAAEHLELLKALNPGFKFHSVISQEILEMEEPIK